VFFPVQKSIELCLNRGSLVALQWMVSKYLHLVLRQMKRYCACVTCIIYNFLFITARKVAPIT
jgi:hypothetical protein